MPHLGRPPDGILPFILAWANTYGILPFVLAWANTDGILPSPQQ